MDVETLNHAVLIYEVQPVTIDGWRRNIPPAT